MTHHLHPQEEYGPCVRIFPKAPSILDIITLISQLQQKRTMEMEAMNYKLLYAST
jgi:hypothetical protein